MNWYVEVLKKYAVFEGRARRKEYWMFVLYNFIIAVVISALEAMVNATGTVSALYALAVFIPSLAVSVRRLHDTGRSGFWLLISFVPVIGLLILLVFLIQEGHSGSNEYGSDPKGSEF